jgi:excinuclease ABC subunit C
MQSLPFTPADDKSLLAAIPAANGVFLLFADDPAVEPYISKTTDLRRRITRLLAPPESQSKRLNLRERCTRIECHATGSDFESTLVLYRVLRKHFPESYAKRMRLQTPPLVRFHWENAYPRAYVTRKLSGLQRKSVYFGPFASRAAAEKQLNDVLDLFKSRRCTFELQPDPAFPGCVYSEMKMCLAPCFKGCTDAEYMAEVTRVQEFFETCGESMLEGLRREREQASADLEFEKAASVHARLEKVTAVARAIDDITQRVDRLDAVIVQPSANADEVALFRFVQGDIVGPAAFSMAGMLPAAGNTTSGDSSLYGQPILLQPVPEGSTTTTAPVPPQIDRLRSSLGALEVSGRTTGDRFGEQLAILKRWYFRSQRTGEIFFRNKDGEWPLRRILNGASRVFAAKAASRSTAG